MIIHYFKMIWNRRKENLLTVVEISFAFLILTALSSFVIMQTEKYLEPLGFNYKNVWMVNAFPKEYYPLDTDEDWKQEHMREKVRNEKMERLAVEIKNVFSTVEYAHPVHFSTMAYLHQTGEDNAFVFGGKEIRYQFCCANEYLKDDLEINLKEGRWFSREDMASSRHQVVLSRKVADVLFPRQNPVGRTFGDDQKYEVLGVVDHFKFNGEFSDNLNLMFFKDTNDEHNGILIKVKNKPHPSFEGELMKLLRKYASDLNFNIYSMEKMRQQYLRKYLVPLIILSVVVAFLIINVMLGLFASLWQNIARRKSEIGIRRAVGSRRSLIQWQILVETYILTSISILIGFVFSSQIFIYNFLDIPVQALILGHLASTLVIFILSTFCALLPARQAANLKPAEAIREEF